MNEYTLIESFQAGDEFAFVGIYNRYKGPVFSFCYKMLHDSDSAEDVMQETFLRIYENRDRLIKTSAFKSWLFTIARNQCLNSIRKNGKLEGFSDENAEYIVTLDTPFSEMEKSDQVEFVTHFLNSLKPDYREILILREYQNLTYEEIGAITRTSVSAVKSRLFKARKKLAGLMESVLEKEQTTIVQKKLKISEAAPRQSEAADPFKIGEAIKKGKGIKN
ncbi:MAG: RNA polymerase sigma factor [Bacteroidetes bacterium]|nr:RNA polymerase sigma factor [Bacteroidota bacterium]